MSQSLPDLMLRRGKGARISKGQPEQRLRRTKRQTVTALAGVPLFTGLSKRHLHRLASSTDELAFDPGETIVREGDLGETLFVVLEGEGKVLRDGRRVGDVLPGDFFGELSAIDGGPRTATVAAETNVRVLRLFRRTLMDLTKDDPSLTVALLDGVVRRLRQIDRRRAIHD